MTVEDWLLVLLARAKEIAEANAREGRPERGIAEAELKDLGL